MKSKLVGGEVMWQQTLFSAREGASPPKAGPEKKDEEKKEGKYGRLGCL